MSALCTTCKLRAYCFILNSRIFQSLGFVVTFDTCPLYEHDPSCSLDDDGQEDNNGEREKGYIPDREETFEINVEVTVQCRMKEFDLNTVKPKSCDQLKRFSVMINKEKLEHELGRIISREIRNKLHGRCKDSVMREDAKSNIEVPLVFSKWVIN